MKSLRASSRALRAKVSKIIKLHDRSRAVAEDDWLLEALGKLPDDNFRKRFWSKVDIRSADLCWNWKAFVTHKGYGQFQIRHQRPAHAHKVALALTKGLSKEKLACHTCDNRLCCNPDHLYEGTPQSNMTDMISRGRAKHPPILGERNGNASLKSEDVRYIRRWYKKMPTREIANYLGCSMDQIYQVATGRTWRHIE